MVRVLLYKPACEKPNTDPQIHGATQGDDADTPRDHCFRGRGKIPPATGNHSRAK